MQVASVWHIAAYIYAPSYQSPLRSQNGTQKLEYKLFSMH